MESLHIKYLLTNTCSEFWLVSNTVEQLPFNISVNFLMLDPIMGQNKVRTETFHLKKCRQR